MSLYILFVCINRKTWVREHEFEGKSAAIFVVALNHYNTVLYEDETKNTMHEAIELFDQVVNCEYFKKSEIILFSNTDDLFREKLLNQQIVLSTCFTHDVGWNGKQWNGPDYKHIDYFDKDDENERTDAMKLQFSLS